LLTFMKRYIHEKATLAVHVRCFFTVEIFKKISKEISAYN